MENYIRYFIKVLIILFLLALTVLFVVLVRDNTKLTKDTLKNINITDEKKNKNNNVTNETEETTVNSSNSDINSHSSSKQNDDMKEVTYDKVEQKANTNIENNESQVKNTTNTSTESKDIDFSLNFYNKTLVVGKTAKIVVDSSSNGLSIKYKSFKTDIATVSESGVIKALKQGSTYIEVNANQKISKVIELIVIDKNTQVGTSSNTNKNNQTTTSSNTNNNNQTTTSSSTNKNNQTTTSSNTSKNNQTTTSSNTSKNNQTTTSSNKNNQPTNDNNVKNGWYNINGKKYYYKAGVKLTNCYVNYIYLDNNGVAQAKIGNFSATLYGALAWTNRKVNIRQNPTTNSKLLGSIPPGTKLTILSSDNSTTKYIKINYNGTIGYVYSDFLLINLPDVMPDIVYSISNADKSIYKAANMSISDVTGKNLYGFSKKYNAKIGKSTYYAPLLYPVAKQLQGAYNVAKNAGYNLKIYDTYRPNDVTKYVNNKFRSLYGSNNSVRKMIDYDKNGNYWGPGWFLANNVSTHNKGIALDLALTDKNNNELRAQTEMHTLDTRSIVKYNNSVANKLRNIMTSQGFETLESEWWHFQENNYNSSPVNTFHLR
mgnify:CR=1 FL=1